MAHSNMDDLKEAFSDFIRDFRDFNGEYKYIKKIERLIIEDQRSLVIDYEDLILMDEISPGLELADTLINNPNLMIKAGNEVLADYIKTEEPEFYKSIIDRFSPENELSGFDEFTQLENRFDIHYVYVRFNNSQQGSRLKIRDIRAKDIQDKKIYWMDGIIIRTTEIKSIIHIGVFNCDVDGHEVKIQFEDGIYSEPTHCDVATCEAKKFYFRPESSRMVDWQFITLQEKPEDLPPGSSPKSIPCQLTDDLVNTVRPGDRINLGGIIRMRPSKAKKKGELLTYDYWVEVNYIESSSKEDELTEITPEEEQEFLEMARDPKVFDKLLSSIAPQIFGMEDVKKSALLMLFGGVDKKFPDGFSTRGQPNVLLIGDPGVAKSQLLRYVQSIAPRGLFTSGKGSSAAGLTAAIVRDPDTGEITLEAGAMVLADRGVCLIDEFDKMSENDRSAIHEAMEQHSYHPNTEIMFSDGTRRSIGEFVDDLFNKNQDKVIDGINCEILPLNGEYLVLSTDFSDFENISVDRVSRHEAPKYFYKITYDNSRSILVTPEHPVYVYDKGITTLDASVLEEGMFVPGPRTIKYLSNIELNTTFDTGRKHIHLPRQLTESLSKFLGYYVAEGYCYATGTYEIGLSNSNPSIIKDMINVIQTTFEITPIDYTDQNRTLRIVSVDLYAYLTYNFPELMVKSIEKRIPSQIFGSPSEFRKSFLYGAFIGDGAVETETLGYSTSSQGLAHDYQDLLLTMGIHSRISSEEYTYDNNTQSRTRYKVYIRGESIESFVKQIIPVDDNSKLSTYRQKIDNLVVRSLKNQRNSDSLPGDVAEVILECIQGLGITYDGYLYQHIEKNYSINSAIVRRYLDELNQRFDYLVHQDWKCTLQEFREFANLSQAQIATISGLTRGNVDYYEHGGYGLTRRDQMLSTIKVSYRNHLSQIREKMDYLENLIQFRWTCIRSIEKIPNEGAYNTKWVYDVTIEPTENFVSHGIILHNTVSIAKAGIVATLNARTGVLAAANPRYGRYEDHRSFNENVNLTPAILSRFDLLFVLRDIPDTQRDGVLASHILKLHRFHGSANAERPPMNEDLLKKYIAYAKLNYHPTLSEEASELLETYYVEMREISGDNPRDRITITARQLEGIIRLAEARARAALKNEVSKSDAQFAIDLMRASLEEIARDPETGQIDIDAFYSGQTGSKRGKLSIIQSIIDNMERASQGKSFSREMLIEKAVSEHNMDRNYVEGVIQHMITDGVLYTPESGKLEKI